MIFDSVVKPLFELLRQPLRYSIGLGIVAAIALFSPNSIINKLGLLKYRDEGKPYLGGFLLLCIAIAVINVIGWGVTKYDDYRFLHAGKKRLNRLTIEEKQVLRAYIEGQTRSIYLNVSSGVVNGLVQESIIYRSSSLSNPEAGRMAFAYNIQPWAWDYLNDHRDLLGRS
jgi:hypothetical protein